MNEGFVKIYRTLVDWEWYDHVPTKVVWLHLLLTANYKESRYRGHAVPAGSKVTGLNALAEQTQLSVRQVRTALKNLQSTGEVTIKTTNKFSIVSIVKWKDYQSQRQAKDKQKTNNRHSIDIQSTTSKEGKKERKKEYDTRAKEYLFEGETFKLTESDYQAFKKNCPKLSDGDYRVALTNCDMAFKHGGSENWFYRLANQLRIEQDKIQKGTPITKRTNFTGGAFL